ncbi:MAG: hypothetical protein Fur0012_05440 [Elusimicrobiota bacterium]
MKKIAIILSFTLLGFNLYASNGESAGSFLRMGAGAKSSAMGEAYSSVIDGADVVYYNPAGVVFAGSKKLSFSHMSYIESTYYDTLYYTHSINENKSLGGGIQYFSYGSIDETDPSGTKVGSYSPKDIAVTMAYSMKIDSKYSFLNGAGVGISAKYINLKVKDSATAFAGDIGFMTPVINKKFRSSLVLQNIGTKIKFDDKKEKLPLTFKTGFSYTPLKELLATADIAFPNDSDAYFSVGSAYRRHINSMNVVLRAGYNGLNKDIGGFSGFNFGVGFEFSKICVDYAFMPYGDMGTGHRVGVSFSF